MDKLGDGTGHWRYVQGSLEITASRPIFDLLLNVSAARAEGNEMVIRFQDRFGMQSHDIHFRDLPAARQPAVLRAFSVSGKGI